MKWLLFIILLSFIFTRDRFLCYSLLVILDIWNVWTIFFSEIKSHTLWHSLFSFYRNVGKTFLFLFWAGKTRKCIIHILCHHLRPKKEAWNYYIISPAPSRGNERCLGNWGKIKGYFRRTHAAVQCTLKVMDACFV